MKIPDNFIIANGPQWLAHGVKTIARRLNLLFFRKNGKIPKSNFNRCVLAEFIIIAFQTKKNHCLRDVSCPPRKQPRSAGAYMSSVVIYLCCLEDSAYSNPLSPAVQQQHSLFSRRNLYSISAEMTRSFMAILSSSSPFIFCSDRSGDSLSEKDRTKAPPQPQPFSFCVPTYSLFNIPSICYDFCLVVKSEKYEEKQIPGVWSLFKMKCYSCPSVVETLDKWSERKGTWTKGKKTSHGCCCCASFFLLHHHHHPLGF